MNEQREHNAESSHSCRLSLSSELPQKCAEVWRALFSQPSSCLSHFTGVSSPAQFGHPLDLALLSLTGETPQLRSPVCLTSWMQLKFYLSGYHNESVTVKSSSDLSCVYLRLHGWVMGGFFGGSHSSSNHEAWWFFIFQLRSFRHPLRVSILMHPLSRSSSDSPLRTLRGCAACPLQQACASAPVILINWLP